MAAAAWNVAKPLLLSVVIPQYLEKQALIWAQLEDGQVPYIRVVGRLRATCRAFRDCEAVRREWYDIMSERITTFMMESALGRRNPRLQANDFGTNANYYCWQVTTKYFRQELDFGFKEGDGIITRKRTHRESGCLEVTFFYVETRASTAFAMRLLGANLY
jgi:hypothetical protein